MKPSWQQDNCDIISLANSGIQGLKPYQAGKSIEELQRELGFGCVVKLASNENPLGPSQYALAACQKAMSTSIRYPDSHGFALKQALSAKLGVDSDQLILGSGSNDILDLVARVFLGPGRSAVVSEHAFVVYPIAVQACTARLIVAPAKAWGHDVDAMLAAVESDTRLLFIANPNNPTGTMLDKASLRRLLDNLPSHVIVVLDEAYFEYVDDSDYPNGINLLPHYPNLIVTRTFSKAWGLAGLRVGYGVASPVIVDLLNRVRAPFNVNSLGLAAAAAVLDDKAYLKRVQKINREGMVQLTTGLKALGLSYIPSKGNFIAVAMPSDPLVIYQQLLEQGVIVRTIGIYGMPWHLRVSIGLSNENQAFLSALGKVLK